ncbi:hypothetical protein [Streptomyces sp. IMTB 1903]|uniref:hypothetical protein n=1 Tax=Streptomyces sp. IMTB 1903 TaxID=1776680 RepID=UPI000B2AF398|nr:hypothetical protein [Streptomyces sp. IMTB 1903]
MNDVFAARTMPVPESARTPAASGMPAGLMAPAGPYTCASDVVRPAAAGLFDP